MQKERRKNEPRKCVTIFEHVNQTEDISKRTRTRTRANKTTTPDGIEKERKRKKKRERNWEEKKKDMCTPPLSKDHKR
jgi:hypothetical protein